MSSGELFLVFVSLCVLLAFVIHLTRKLDTVQQQKPGVGTRQTDTVIAPTTNVGQIGHGNVPPPLTQVGGPQRYDLALGPNRLATDTARRNDSVVQTRPAINPPIVYSRGITTRDAESTRNEDRVVRAQPSVGFAAPDTREVLASDAGSSPNAERLDARTSSPLPSVHSLPPPAERRPEPPRTEPVVTYPPPGPVGRITAVVSGDLPSKISQPHYENPLRGNSIVHDRPQPSPTPPSSSPYRVTDSQSGVGPVVTIPPPVGPVGRITAVVSDPPLPPTTVSQPGPAQNTRWDDPHTRPPPPPPPSTIPQTRQTSAERTETPTDFSSNIRSIPPQAPVAIPQTRPVIIPQTGQITAEGINTSTDVSQYTRQRAPVSISQTALPPPPPSQPTNAFFLRPPPGNDDRKNVCVKLSDLTDEELERVDKDVSRCSLTLNTSCLADAIARIRSVAPRGADNNAPLFVVVQFRKDENKSLTKSEKAIRKSLKIHSDTDDKLCRLARFRFRDYDKDGIRSPLEFHDFTPYVGEYAPHYNPFTHNTDATMRCEWKMCYGETSVGSTKCKNLKYAHILVPK